MQANYLHCQQIGNGPDLVLLHGWGWDMSIWQTLVPHLITSYRLTLIDLPNHGKSSILANQNHSLCQIAQAILHKAPAKAIWIGWSLGGSIATWIAIHYPLRVKKLVLLASSPRFLEGPNWPGVKRRFFEKFNSELATKAIPTMKKFLILQSFPYPHPHLMNKWLKKILFFNTKQFHIHLRQSLKVLSETDLREKMRKIQCPSILFLGEEDLLTPISLVNKLENHMPRMNVVTIPKSSHLFFLSQTKLFLEALIKFLNDDDSSAL